jgi:uncharacterized protein YbjT (DUF2867 family)
MNNLSKTIFSRRGRPEPVLIHHTSREDTTMSDLSIKVSAPPYSTFTPAAVETGLSLRRVVVLGAGGQVGRLVVEELLRTGHEVTAAVRRPDTVQTGVFAGFRGRLEVIRADARDPLSLQAAVKGQDAVVSAIGPAGRRANGLYSDGARAIVTAMEREGVQRVIALSSAGARRDDPHFSWWYRVLSRTLLQELYDDMRQMEQMFRDSHLDWTIVRPSRMNDEAATGTYRVQDGETPRRGWQVSRADVARFIVQELVAPRWERATPTLAK